MSINNSILDINELIQFSGSGIEVASFVQIRAALIARYQTVYGSDIDVSTASADGVFVNDLALIMNNILQVVKTMYANLDANTATGVYLDAICRLANVVRREATHSNASLQVTNLNNTISDAFAELTFIDQAGNEWLSGPVGQFAAHETKIIQVTAVDPGPIVAPASWINQTIQVTYLQVVQPEDANVGSNQETDGSLRTRRTQSSGAAGATVLESLFGALLNVSGIQDVQIYNNNTGSQAYAKDMTTILAHSIYVVLRYIPGVTISDSLIGTIIYNKMTPGISTNASVANNKKSYNYIPSVLGVPVTIQQQMVYWKQAIPVSPMITLTLQPQSFFTSASFSEIAGTLFDYLNNLPLSEDLSSQLIMMEAVMADPTFKGRSTYFVQNVTIAGQNASGFYMNPDTFFKYSNFNFTQNTSTGIWTLTLS